ncbi:MAG: hypothetical protein KF746_15655 [Chitinophagaceae bacterium]|nr:hypothetical protein [Chitinophagaceae bacterium]
MENAFYVQARIKTAEGFKTFCQFFLGNDPQFAYDAFHQLKGNEDTTENDILHIDFIEMKNGLPVNLKLISCTLDDFCANTRLLTKEAFKNLSIHIDDINRVHEM